VLVLLAAGNSNRQIASELFVALSTVKTHIKNIYGKLDVRNRTQAVSRAGELGLL
jgi:LuxR family maltose regulon positive regulatory protein